MTDHQDRKLFTIVTTYQRYDIEKKEYRIDDSFIVNYNTALELINSIRPETKEYSHQGVNYFITEVLSYGVYQKRITLESLFEIASKELAEKREKYFPVVSGNDKEDAVK
jgi:hypothetical protein